MLMNPSKQLSYPCPFSPAPFPRRPYERLLRKVLSLPNNPAVILVHSYAWFKADPHQGTFYNNAERDYNELAEYYGLPAVSVKSCCFEAMRNDEPGFQVGCAVTLWLRQWGVSGGCCCGGSGMCQECF